MVLTDLIAAQGGVATRRQLLASGVTPDAIRAHLWAGRWQRLHRATYALFTGEPTRQGWFWAAVLHAGDGALLSHHTAAELDGLADAPSAVIHVTIPARRRLQPVDGIRLHLSQRAGHAAHPSRRPPRTRVEETVLDLVECSGNLDAALSWVATACGRRLTTPQRMRQALDARAKCRWRLEVGAALEDAAAGAHSLLELRYLRDVERAHGLPSAARQVARQRPGGRYYDDVRYSGYSLHVELDGRAAHPVGALGRDRRRDNSAVTAGGAVLRYGWAEVTGHPCVVAAQVATALRARGWPGTPRACGRCCMIPKSLGC